MPKIAIIPRRTFQFIVLIISFVSLTLGTVLSPPNRDQVFPLIGLLVIIGVLEFLPLDLFGNKYSLINIIVFSAGLIYGTGLTTWACLIGIAGAVSLQYVFAPRWRSFSSNQRSALWGGIFDFGINVGSLLLTLMVFGMTKGVTSIDFNISQGWIIVLGAGVFFGIIHGISYYLASKYSIAKQYAGENWDNLALVSIEILPLFFGFTTLLVYPIIGDGSLIVLGVSTFALELLIYYLGAPRKQLERRFQELSALEEISKVLSADIELEKLLTSIQVQVTDLLNVDNFYVALLDPVDQQIWYPLAVKHGTRQNWQRRPLTDRLTDRVILESEPILLPHNGRQQLTKIGLPAGEDAPYAWIGVPLITSEHTIGCLALFSMTPEAEFSQDDLNLLSILSGQTSVAIEIALHNALLSSDVTIGRDKLTIILNSVHDGLILIDEEGKITLANEAVTFLTGIPQSEFIGHKFPELPTSVIKALDFSASDASNILEQISGVNDLQSTKHAYKIENRSPELFIERSLIPVQDKLESLSGLIITLRDVTDEHQLKQTQDLISETLVHDLRSPLSSTISALDVINDAYANGDPAGILEPSIQIAKRSSRRMLLMVESILEINRMESGKIELSLSKVDPETLLKDSIAEFHTLSKDYNVGIKFEPAPKIPLVTLDENKIQRVINNLIDNALKFSSDGDEVIIMLKTSSYETIEIHVLDRGPGIPEEYAESIFDRFFQIPDRSSRKRGSGLGLTYCRLTAEAHEGKIWVEKRPGGGSIFVVSLPISGPTDENK
jgi:PAS domain S-box-containing protein